MFEISLIRITEKPLNIRGFRSRTDFSTRCQTQIKAIKIQPRFILRKYDKTVVPEILLKGKWLAEIGFVAGQEVKIESSGNTLVIILIKRECKKAVSEELALLPLFKLTTIH